MKKIFNPLVPPFDSVPDSLSDIDTRTHSLLTSLTTDDHTQYLLLLGRAGGQIAIGGTASGDDLTLQSTSNATRGTIFFGSGGNDWYSEADGRISLGGNSTASGYINLVETPTITSGTINGIFNNITAAPSSSSSATVRNANFQLTVDATAAAITGNAIAFSANAFHNGNNNVTNLYGLQLQAFIGPLFGAPTGTASTTTYYGAVFQLLNKSGLTSASTSAVDQHGGYFSSRISSPSNVTRLSGAFIEAGGLTSGSGVGTTTNFYFARMGRRNPAGTNVLSGGTNTNSYGLWIDGWPTGPTYTNTPIQLNLEDNDVTTIAIRQQDLDATNQLGGNTTIGAVAAPQAALDVQQDSATAAIPTLYLNQLDVSEEMIELNTTIGTGNAIEAVGAKTLTTTHFIKVTIPGGLTRYIPCGTIA